MTLVSSGSDCDRL